MSGPLRLAYIYPEHLARPAARVLQMAATLRALAAVGVEVDFMVGRYRGLAGSLAQLGLQGVEGLKVHPLAMWQSGPGSRAFFSWHGRFHRSALKVLEQSGIKLVLVRHLKLAGFLLRRWQGHGRRLVFEAHEIFHQTARENKMDPAKLARLEKLERGVLGRSDGVAAISQPLAEDLKPFLAPGAPLCVAPSGVDDFFFSPGLDSRRDDLAAYAGGLMPWKGVDLLLEAMGRLEQGKLELLGGRAGSADWRRLQALAAGLNLGERLVMRPRADQEEVLSLLGRAGVAVWPGTGRSQIAARHTSPLKLFEYLAAGCAVVAPRLPAALSVLTQDENALLFEPDDPGSLAVCLERLFGDPVLARKLGRNGRELAKGYSWRNRALALKGLLAGLEQKK